MGRLSMRLRQRIRLQQSTVSQDADTGEPTESWATYRRCFADIQDTAGREVIRGDGFESVVSCRVRIRYPREGRIPTSDDRVLYFEDGTETQRTLNVEIVKRLDGERRWLDLMCREDVE